MEYFLNAFKYHYADFDGRARRSEFWFFYLFWILSILAVAIVAGILTAVLGDIGGIIGIIGYSILILAGIIPYLAVAVRRLHDTGKSGWWMLISLIPIASIVLLVFFCLDSEPGPNLYGENPKELGGDSLSHHLIEDDGVTV